MSTVFVIPHKGRSEYLRQTLQSIAEQVSYSGSIEVVIVTKELSLDIDPTIDNANENGIPVSVLNVGPDLTISSQRNLGVASSSSDHLAFVDADISLAPNWLATMQQLLYATAGRVIVSAVQHCSETSTALEVIRTDQVNVQIDTDLKHMHGRNLFMRRAHFEAIVGFPEHLMTCEDYYFTGQAATLGSLYNSSQSSYVHLGEDKLLMPMFFKEIWRGASNLQSIEGRAIGFHELPSFLVPIWMVLFFLATLLSLFKGTFAVLAISVFCFLVPPTMYSFRLKHLTHSSAGMLDMIIFYGVYFTSRGIGMFIGLPKALSGVGRSLSKGGK